LALTTEFLGKLQIFTSLIYYKSYLLGNKLGRVVLSDRYLLCDKLGHIALGDCHLLCDKLGDV
jgi:hypothetical protein